MQIMAVYCYKHAGVTGLIASELVPVLDRLLVVQRAAGRDIFKEDTVKVLFCITAASIVLSAIKHSAMSVLPELKRDIQDFKLLVNKPRNLIFLCTLR